jgi:hypothetical protein
MLDENFVQERRSQLTCTAFSHAPAEILLKTQLVAGL